MDVDPPSPPRSDSQPRYRPSAYVPLPVPDVPVRQRCHQFEDVPGAPQPDEADDTIRPINMYQLSQENVDFLVQYVEFQRYRWNVMINGDTGEEEFEFLRSERARVVALLEEAYERSGHVHALTEAGQADLRNLQIFFDTTFKDLVEVEALWLTNLTPEIFALSFSYLLYQQHNAEYIDDALDALIERGAVEESTSEADSDAETMNIDSPKNDRLRDFEGFEGFEGMASEDETYGPPTVYESKSSPMRTKVPKAKKSTASPPGAQSFGSSTDPGTEIAELQSRLLQCRQMCNMFTEIGWSTSAIDSSLDQIEVMLTDITSDSDYSKIPQARTMVQNAEIQLNKMTQ